MEIRGIVIAYFQFQLIYDPLLFSGHVVSTIISLGYESLNISAHFIYSCNNSIDHSCTMNIWTLYVF